MNPIVDIGAQTYGGGDVPVAIVGIGALFPGANDLDQYWDNVLRNIDCITDVPEHEWRVDDYFDPDPRAEDKTYSKRGGFIPPVQFDPMEYGIPPKTVEATSVLQLLSLVIAKQTLTDSGCFDNPEFDRSKAGVVLGTTGANALVRDMMSRMQAPLLTEVLRSSGLSKDESEAIVEKYKLAYAPWQENSFPGILGNVVAGRIANRFDLGAMNCTTDAACASSLAAVNVAIAELSLGRADFMIAGGCDLENSPTMYVCFSKTPALSMAGEVRPFDENADGTLIGQGIGMVGLKRLVDAERDGDRIYATIKGIGSSSDGRFKSIYAPRVEGQVSALRRAYAAAEVAPETVRLLECHGTGTMIGDQVEIAALKEVFEFDELADQTIAIGSVKSQIGHTKSAAGIAGIIKVALALHQRVLPPTHNVTMPKGSMGFDESPLYPNVTARPWVSDPRTVARRAGVSSFGFGGTNFHCVLEEPPRHSDEESPAWRTVVTYLWHAPTSEELIAAIDREPLRRADDSMIPREHARLAIVVDRTVDVHARRAAALDHIRSGGQPPAGVHYRDSGIADGKVAALFAGQGSQYVNMGAGAAMAFPCVLDAFDAMAREFVSGVFGPTVFPPSAFTPAAGAAHEDALRATDLAQPAIGALAQGQFDHLRSLGFSPDGALGHSYGEVVALWAAGSFDDDTFRKLTVARGAAMAKRPDRSADPGSMAAVAATAAEVEGLIADRDELWLCNVNAPNQVVVGGHTKAITEFVALCRSVNIAARTLTVAAAFHTPLIEHAVSDFREVLEDVHIGPPAVPVFADTASVSYGTDVAANRDVLANQMVSPVAFADRLVEMYEQGFRVFVEFGPKSTLSDLVRRTLDGRGDISVVAVDGGPSVDGEFHAVDAIARLVVLGLPLTGLNRGVRAARPQAEEAGKGTILLHGSEYVTEERRQTFLDSLDSGYTIERLTTVNDHPDASEHVTSPEAAGDRGPQAMSNGDAAISGNRNSIWDIANEHLSMHRAYLASQLSIADRVSGLLSTEAAQTVRRDVIDGIDAVVRQSAAISEGHIHASGVLRSFAELESGSDAGRRNGSFAGSVIDGSTGSGAAALSPAPYWKGNDHLGLNESAGNRFVQNGFGVTGAGADGAAVDGTHVNGAGPSGSVGDETPGIAKREDLLSTETARAVTLPSDVAEITELMLGTIADKTGYPADMLDLQMAMEADLGIDSIKRVEILSSLQDSFPDIPPPPPEEVFSLSTLQDIVDYLAKLSGVGATGSPVVADDEVILDPKVDGGSTIVRRDIDTIVLPAVDVLVDPFRSEPIAVFGGAVRDLPDGFADVLRRRGWAVHEEDQAPDASRIDLALWVMSADDRRAPDHVVDELAEAVSFTGSVLGRLAMGSDGARTALLAVTRGEGTTGVDAPSLPNAVASGVAGLIKTAGHEGDAVYTRLVDIDIDLDSDAACAALVKELYDCDTSYSEVGVRADGQRVTRVAMASTELGELPSSGEIRLGADDLVLVTGGGRGITAACVLELADRCEACYLLAGSTAIEAEPEWTVGVPDTDLRRALAEHSRSVGRLLSLVDIATEAAHIMAVREVHETLTALEAAGRRATYLHVDLTDAAAVARTIGPFAERITALVHGAGAIRDSWLSEKKADDVRHVLDVKISGLLNVLGVLEISRLRHVGLFASVAGFYGNPGQADYATGNESINRVAGWIAGRNPQAQVTAVNWGPWNGGMVRPELATIFRDHGVAMVDMVKGTAAFVDIFTRAPGISVELVGSREPLVDRSSIPVRAGGVQVVRSMAPVYASAVIADHALAGKPVLPAAWAMGALLNIARGVTGVTPLVWTDFRVLKGIVCDGSEPDRLITTARYGDDGGLTITAADAGGRPRYRLTVRPEEDRAPLPPPLRPVPVQGSGDPTTAYDVGHLFHGPLLRGVRRIISHTDSELIAECRLDPAKVADGAYEVGGYDPVLGDVVGQVVAPWIRNKYGKSPMPAAVARVDSYRRLPHDEPYYVVASGFTQTSENVVVGTLTSYDLFGVVLQVIDGFEAVMSEALNGLFAAGGAQ
ncbi:type I polyketide synthase [Rhodococcoides yunnanense]|uniref:type I polyketide synthase n=1 Tax=Rhodococcoides yunnanense TaxID=278209 RepID=UPI0009320D8D|nr:type I polyketide synthase [Rhodococcus yunnanensis]